MPINFPSSPTSGSQYTYGSKTWQWNGYAWDIVTPTTISTFNGCTSSAITITGTANEVTVDTTCPNIVIGLPNNLVVQNLTVTGSLLVSGGITTQMSEVVLIEDNFVTLNANVTAGAPTENAGIIISRGASANVDLRWNETSDNWQFTNNGTDYWNLPINVVNTFNGLTGAVSFAVPVASFTVTGAASFNGNDFTVGSTGHVGLTATIARTNVTNTFSASQSIAAYQPYFLIEDTDTNTFFDIIPHTGMIRFNNAFYDQYLLFNGLSDFTVTLPDFTTTLAGLSGTQTFTGRKTFSSLASFSNGLSANGATFSGNISAPNIVNSVNGSTGAVNFAVPVASFTVTGAASFNGNDFTVGSTGHVGLTGTIARTNVNNQFSTSQTVSGDIIASQLQAGNDLSSGIVLVRNGDILHNTDSLGDNQRLVFSPAGNSVITLPSGVSGTVALVGTTVATVNSQTGAVGITGSGAILFVQSGKTGTFDARLASASATGVASFGNQFVVSAAGAVSLTSNYVSSVNGSTGAITIQGLTGITASVSGQTIRLSHVVTNDNTNNTRYLAFYGVTSGVDAAKVDENLRYNPLVNTISAYGGLVLNGLSSGGVAATNQIVLTDPNIGGISLNSSNYIVDISSAGGAGDVSSIRLMSYDGLDNGWKATISPATYYSTDRTFTLPDDSGIVALTKNVATSVNGATGAVTITGAGAMLFTHSGKTGTFNARLASASATGVASFGNEFVVSALGAVSLTSNYVKSINGSTGAITNVARTNVDNVFSANQSIITANAVLTIVDSSSLNEVTFQGEFNRLYFYNDSSGGEVLFGPTIAPGSTITVYLPDFSTTLAGLAGTQTFTGLKTFSQLTTHSAGITASNLHVSQGATFAKLSVNNGDFLATTVGGEEGGEIHFGLAATGTSLTGAYVVVDIYQNKMRFFEQGGSNRGYYMDLSAASNAVGSQLVASAANTFTGLQTMNAGITSNNLYVSQGTTFAGTVISDTGYRISSSAINAQTGTSYTLTGTDNGKIVTFNNGSAVTVTIPTGLPVGFNCTAIQLGAGQVGFTAASGVTMNAYASAYKISGQHGAAALVSYTTNIFNLSGTLSV